MIYVVDIEKCWKNLEFRIFEERRGFGIMGGKIVLYMELDSLEFEFWIFYLDKLMNLNEIIYGKFLA